MREAGSPVEARLAAAELFIHALRADGAALTAALATLPGAAPEAELFGAWAALLTGAPVPDVLPAELFGTTVTLLEALLRVAEFDAFGTLHGLFTRIDVAPAVRSDVLAAIYFRRGFLDSAADEWIACVEAEPTRGRAARSRARRARQGPARGRRGAARRGAGARAGQRGRRGAARGADA